MNGKCGMEQTSSISGDALLQAALDVDGDSDSNNELSDDPAPYIDRELINKPKRPEEEFEPHETDPSKISAVFRLELADGSGWYVQRDVLPEQRSSEEEDTFDEYDSLFFPDLTTYKVPHRPHARKSVPHIPWIKTSAWRWERTVDGKTEIWSPNFVFRRFNARTHKYEKIYVCEKRVNNVDPNDKGWMYGYNKWIDQIKRRSDSSYVQEKRRDHWTVPEICAMYTGINDFLHTNGIDAYHGITTASLQKILDAINAVGNKNRGIDALRGQMSSAHKLKNPSLAYLRENARDLAEYLADGGIISDAERFPEKFIPEEEFPTAPRRNAQGLKSEKKSLEQEANSGAADSEIDADDEMEGDESDDGSMGNVS